MCYHCMLQNVVKLNFSKVKTIWNSTWKCTLAMNACLCVLFRRTYLWSVMWRRSVPPYEVLWMTCGCFFIRSVCLDSFDLVWVRYKHAWWGAVTAGGLYIIIKVLWPVANAQTNISSGEMFNRAVEVVYLHFRNTISTWRSIIKHSLLFLQLWSRL